MLEDVVLIQMQKFFREYSCCGLTVKVLSLESFMLFGRFGFCLQTVEYAKKYYGCDDIEGVYLENQGGSGTAR